MSGQLLALAIGPVQEFIAAARRTRDLWFGSYLLSEISKSAAKAVQDGGGVLVFPAPANAADLCPDSKLNVANVIVAELHGQDPKSLASEAKRGAIRRWRDFADKVFGDCRDAIDTDIGNDQVDDIIEFYAAWQPFMPETYREDRALVMRLLSARKQCRDFLPAKGRAGVPKSSLDGLRESVLQRAGSAASNRRLRLRTGEELDVVGLVKRAWAPSAAPIRYPSVARVAADPWLRRIPPDELDALKNVCTNLGTDTIHELDVSAGGHPQYVDFPFEGTAVFRSRHRELCEEARLSESDIKPLALAVDKLVTKHGEPSPYLAVLVADGDRIGESISRFSAPDDHRKFSQALAGFATRARMIVDEHGGVLVYAGGDDALAFLPVDHCLACARALHDRFGGALKRWSEDGAVPITLSVGIAVAHFMEPLEDLLGYARAAERDAKGLTGERDGLAVHVVKRGGGPLSVRGNWNDRLDELLTNLAGWVAAESISGRIAYELREIAGIYDTWPVDIVGDAIRRDVLSVMEGKQPAGSSRMGDIKKMVGERVKDAASLRKLSMELLIAKALRPARGIVAGDGVPT